MSVGSVAVNPAVVNFLIQIGLNALGLVVAAAQVHCIWPANVCRALVQTILVGACLVPSLHGIVIFINVGGPDKVGTIAAHSIKCITIAGSVKGHRHSIFEPLAVDWTVLL